MGIATAVRSLVGLRWNAVIGRRFLVFMTASVADTEGRSASNIGSEDRQQSTIACEGMGKVELL